MAAFPRNRTAPGVLFLLLLLTLGGTGAGGKSPAPVGGTVAAGLPGPDDSAVPPILAQVSPDIAFTSPFRSGGLLYAHSAAFAEAMQAVASGSSRYSPGTIPPSWMHIAREWEMHVTGCDCGTTFRHACRDPAIPGGSVPLMSIGTLFHLRGSFRDGDDGVLSLLFLSSLEFRVRQGDARIRPILPSRVRMAVSELQASILNRWKESESLESRLHEIAARIVSAERMGAQDRFPREFALVQAELRYARHASADGMFDLEEAETSILRAKEAAVRLLGRLKDRPS